MGEGGGGLKIPFFDGRHKWMTPNEYIHELIVVLIVSWIQIRLVDILYGMSVYVSRRRGLGVNPKIFGGQP